MSHQRYVRDLCLMTAVAATMVAAVIAFGALAGVAVLVAAMVAGWFAAITRKIDATDEWCARIDQELDEQKAANALRVQHTVHAEPRAPVVDITTRKPIA